MSEEIRTALDKAARHGCDCEGECFTQRGNACEWRGRKEIAAIITAFLRALPPEILLTLARDPAATAGPLLLALADAVEREGVR